MSAGLTAAQARSSSARLPPNPPRSQRAPRHQPRHRVPVLRRGLAPADTPGLRRTARSISDGPWTQAGSGRALLMTGTTVGFVRARPRSSEQLAQVEQVEHAALNLELARQPCAHEAARISGNPDDDVAVRGEPDLCRRGAVLSLTDGLGAVGPDPGQERNA